MNMRLPRFRLAAGLVCGLVFGLLLSISCRPEEIDGAPVANDRRLWRDLPRDGTRIAYGGRDLSPADYAARQREDGVAFQAELAGRFGLDFKLHLSRNFFLAYRGAPARVPGLARYQQAFLREIYPRYFRYEPRAAFRVVYFADKSEYKRSGGLGGYGYFAPGDGALYTYMGSGHGTLWHELIHAFVHENLAAQPQQWFSEGFASFYEMAFLRGDRVVEGYTNWRLPALQQNLRAGRVLPLREALLLYGFEPGFDYPEARFFFCWLWTRRLLVPFVNAYMYELAPRYSGVELGQQAIRKLEGLSGMRIDAIDREFRALALRVKKNQKLER